MTAPETPPADARLVDLAALIVELDAALLAESASLRAQRDQARDIAVALEQQNAAALALHQPVSFDAEAVADDYVPTCAGCGQPNPCATRRALGEGQT